MTVGAIAAAMLQTLLIVVFLAILTPMRFPVIKVCGVFGGLAVVLCVLAGALAGGCGIEFLAIYGFILISLPLFIMLRLFSDVGGIRFIFVVLTALIFHQMLRTLLTAFRVWEGGNFTWLYFAFSVTAFGLLLVGGVILRADFHKIVVAYRTEFICLTPILMLLFLMAWLFSPVEGEISVDGDLLLITLGIDLLTVLIYLYIGVSFHSLGKRCDDARDTISLRLQMEEAQTHIALLRASQEKAAFYRHDLHHHILLIRAYLDQGEAQKLRDYLDEIQAEMEADTVKQYCQNEAANLILISYFAKARAVGVQLQLDTVLSHSLPVSNPELCTLLSNALENAIAAVEKVGKGVEKTVHLMAKMSEGKLLIQVENPYIGEIKMEHGLPQSRCVGHGLGTASMAAIVKKYNGLFAFTAKEQVFTVRIVI